MTSERNSVVWWLQCVLTITVAVFFSSCATHNPATDFSKELETMPGGGVYIEGVKNFDRFNVQHGVFALAPLIQFWGKDPLTKEQEDMLADDPAHMIPVEETMTLILESRDLWPFAFYGTMDELETRLSAGIPVLVIFQSNPMRIETRRYVVVAGFNREAEKLLIYQGGNEPVVYTYAQFRKLWRPVRNWMMVVCPPEKVTWKMRVIEQVSRARYRERRGDWAGAIRDYEEVESQIPDNPDVMLAKARALYSSGNPEGAIALYRRVLEFDQLNARAANNLAYSIVESGGDAGEAERLSRRALTIEPSNPVYLDTLGFILMKMNRPREAAEVLERAVYRAESLDTEVQRAITTRLIEAFLNSDQAHLAKQVWTNQQSKDPDYFLPDDLMKRLPK